MEKTNILKHVLTTALLLLVSLPSWSADGVTFTANTIEGVSMIFKVISENEKTCQVGDGSSTSISSSYSGAITIPSSVNGYSVTRLVYNAFGSCTGLTSITIPSSVTSIGNNTFSGCSSLTSITFPESVTSIGQGVFSGCSSLTSPIYNSHYFAFMPRTYEGAYEIPSGIETVATQAFYYCRGLTSVTIPSSVTTIGSNAFYSCSNLISITIPESVTTIGSQAFEGCTSLTSPIYNSHVFAFLPKTYEGAYEIPTGIESVAPYAFYACKKITSVNIPESVTTIESSAFYNCTGLTSVNLSEGVTSIGYRAFSGCSGLTSITIPESVTSIGEYTFEGCINLTDVTILGKIDKIMDNTFNGCSNLTTISLPESIIEIGKQAFYGCSMLHNVSFSPTKPVYFYTTSFWQAQASFYSCSSLPVVDNIRYFGNFAIEATDKNKTSYTIKEGTTEIAFVFQECNKLTNVTFPTSLKVIGQASFSKCSSLTSIIIPFGVTTIGDCAFYYSSSLTSITIPESVTSIVSLAFDGCSSLTTVISEIEKPFALGTNAFYNIPSNCVLTVPYGTKDAYIAAGWTEDVFKGGIVEAPKPQAKLAISDASGLVGCTFNLPVSMKNEDEITAMQFELCLPEGVSVADATLTDRKNGHSIDYTLQENGNYQFTVFSSSSKAINGNEGDVANISLNISNSVAPGSYTIQMKNIELTTTAGDAIHQSDLSATLTVLNLKPGDVNGDDKLSITDAVGIVNYILGKTSANFHPEAADLNGDGSVSITDAVRVVNIILNQSAGVKERRRTLEMETEREPQ